jgi:hypothetical protein
LKKGRSRALRALPARRDPEWQKHFGCFSVLYRSVVRLEAR